MGGQPCGACPCDDSSQQDQEKYRKPVLHSAWGEEQVCDAVVKALKQPVVKQQNAALPLQQETIGQAKIPLGKSFGDRDLDHHRTVEDTGQPAEQALSFHLAAGVDLGLELAEVQGPSGNRLVVADIDPHSPLACPAEGCLAVVAGDVITQVSGQRAPVADLRASLEQGSATGGLLRLAVLPRPPQFEVRLRRVEGSKLGLLVMMDMADPDRISVRAVRAEGIVPDWNASNACLRVVAGDWVTQVNGRSRGAQEMYRDCTASEGAELRMRILTPPRQAG